MKFTFFNFYCNSMKYIRKTFFNDITLKYLSEHNKILFLFNNIDPFICKKQGYYIFFEAFRKRKHRS